VRIRPIADSIICVEGDFGDSYTSGGILIKSTIGKAEGITPRWFRVLAVGPEIRDIKPHNWVLVSYGRWTEGVEIEDDRLPGGRGKIWRVEAESCLAWSAERPEETLNINLDVVTAQRKTLEI